MENTENKEVSNKKEHKTNYNKIIFIVIVISFIASSFFGAMFGFMAAKIGTGKFDLNFLKKNSANKQISASSNSQIVSVPSEDSAVVQAVKKDSPAVVSIIISKNVPQMPDFFSDPFFDPFGFQQQQPSQDQGSTGQKQEVGAGSGFIVSSDGLVVTNKHVVSDQSASYTVMTNDEKKYEAKVLAIDQVNDVAILKIEAVGLPVLEMGDSSNLQIGQTVIAIGNSLGEFRNTVSKGIISGLKRNVMAGSGRGDSENLSEVIQTDAAINPGNSGGPLLDIQGKVIGVNVAMAQGAQNIGFALPIGIVKKDIDSVKSSGKIVQPYIGVRYLPIDEQIQKGNNLPFDYGVLVARGQQITDFAVVPGSPADKAGIVENDIILEINGTKIDAGHPFVGLLSQYNVGDVLTLKILHKGETKDVQVALDERK
ncbi:MAG: trypsin-like peptidase domain-containing protein [Candidatus Moraniibacteriota bacterium]